jgi:prepilin-type N-terminal cleavage/methylation domain-containing protein
LKFEPDKEIGQKGILFKGLQASGFTLIEIVITIALAGIVMMMITPFFQSGIINKPGTMTTDQRLQDAMALQRVMENMNGAYGMILKEKTAALQALALQTFFTNIGTVGSSFTNKFGAISPYYVTVWENKFITFKHNGEEEDGGTMILKVTIRSTTTPGHQLTQLFTVQVPH